MSEKIEERSLGSGVRLAVWEKKKDDGKVMRWVQLSKYDKFTDRWVNFPMFKESFEILGYVHNDVMEKMTA